MRITPEQLQDELDGLRAEVTRLRGEVTDFERTADLVRASQLNATEREELTRLRNLLASGQVVDLSKVTDDDITETIFNIGEPDRTDRAGGQLRAWLVKKARPKV